MIGEYLVANLTADQMRERAFRFARKSLDGTLVLVPFRSTESPWAGEVRFLDDNNPDHLEYMAGPVYLRPPPLPEKVSLVRAKILMDSRDKQSAGTIHTAGAYTVRLDTTPDGYDKLLLEATTAVAGFRGDVGIWKFERLQGDEYVTDYINASDAVIGQAFLAVRAHVQRCVAAERNAIAKLSGGDITASFQAEFDLLEP